LLFALIIEASSHFAIMASSANAGSAKADASKAAATVIFNIVFSSYGHDRPL
jgi:hypothetical protein